MKKIHKKYTGHEKSELIPERKSRSLLFFCLGVGWKKKKKAWGASLSQNGVGGCIIILMLMPKAGDWDVYLVLFLGLVPFMWVLLAVGG